MFAQYLTEKQIKESGKFKTEDSENAAQLFAHVDHADYDDIARMWKENPQLMFIEVKDKDGNISTPYKRALFNLDTYTWKPFEKWIRENRPELEREYQRQKEEQKEHINLQPVFDAYETYDTQINGTISDKEAAKQWLILGKELKKTLPRHMLREFCRDNKYSWDKTSTFDVDTLPAPIGGRILLWLTGTYINLDSAEFDAGFGSSFSIYRGWGVGGAGIPTRGRIATLDADTFRQLYKIRTLDLAK